MKKFLHFLLQIANCNLQFASAKRQTFSIASVFLFSIFYLLFSICSLAQAPQSFNYQLIARDTAGLVLGNHSLGIKISILKDASNGTEVYCERHTATSNNYGLVNLSIGTGSIVSGLFSTIDWVGHPHFLKLEIDPAGGTSYFTLGTIQLVSVPYSLFAEKSGTLADTNNLSKWTQTGDNIYNNNSGNVGIGINAPAGKLIVKGDSLAPATEPLFEVKNSDGDPVFIVYPDSVRITFTQSSASKATAQGGFAVSGRSSSKGATSNYLVITPDSSRIYLEESSGKGNAQGGFAVSGRSSSKGTSTDYLNVSVDTNETIIQSQPRILWYPSKEAFLTGRVLIQSPDSVGTNSFASGFESKAIGDKSQALGHQSIARGEYSTAIGKNAIANSLNSYAFGDGAKALNEDAYAFGAFTEARGIGSFAFGYVGRDSIGPTGHVTKASGNYSFAFGMGAQAMAEGSIAIGAEDTASGSFSLSMGYKTKASAFYSSSFGYKTTASGQYSVAMGSETEANGNYSFAAGINSIAGGSHSFAAGSACHADNVGCVAMGYSNVASGSNSVAIGNNNNAIGISSIAFGRNGDATGNYSAVLGYGNEASGDNSTALNSLTTASGDYSIAMGYNTTASGSYSMASGYNTIASGSYSATMGSSTSARGSMSTAFGYNTIAKPYASFVIGRYNDTTGTNMTSWITTDPLFVCGNGISTARNNAFTILKNGKVGIGVAAPNALLDVNGSTILGGTVVIGANGTTITNIIKATVSADLPSIAADDSYDQTFTVPNAVTGSTVFISPSGNLTDGLVISYAWVSAVDTVTVKFRNTSPTTAIDLSSRNWYITVIK